VPAAYLARQKPGVFRFNPNLLVKPTYLQREGRLALAAPVKIDTLPKKIMDKVPTKILSLFE
jgi:hypothetical protein